jgi:hypothetical protein
MVESATKQPSHKKKKKKKNQEPTSSSRKNCSKTRMAASSQPAPGILEVPKTRSTFESLESEDDSEEMNEFGEAMAELSGDREYEKHNLRVNHTVQPRSISKFDRNDWQKASDVVDDDEVSEAERKNLVPQTEQFKKDRSAVSKSAHFGPGSMIQPKLTPATQPLSIQPQTPQNRKYFQRTEFKCSFAKLNGPQQPALSQIEKPVQQSQNEKENFDSSLMIQQVPRSGWCAPATAQRKQPE